MSKEDLVFPGELRVKNPSALESPEVPRAQIGGVKHDLVFPEGEEARESKSIQGKVAQEPYAGCIAPGRVFAFRALTAVYWLFWWWPVSWRAARGSRGSRDGGDGEPSGKEE